MAADMPRAIHSAVMEVGPLKLTVHNLSDGQRVVDAEDFERCMHWLNTGEVLPASRIEARRAATVKQGAVHESPTAEGGDAQTASHPKDIT